MSSACVSFKLVHVSKTPVLNPTLAYIAMLIFKFSVDITCACDNESFNALEYPLLLASQEAVFLK